MKTKQSRKTFRIRQEEMKSRLRQDILEGVRRPGEFLPSEKDLSDRFALSNKIVRDVLAELAAEGLIEKKPRIGSVVAQRSEPERVIVKLGHHGSTLQESALRALLAGFEAMYPHIRVQDVTLPGHDPEVLKPYLAHGLIDVLTLNDAELRAFGETGDADLLLPLEGDPECYPFLADAMSSGGALLAKPFTFSPTILCYNREHFRERDMWEPDSGWGWDELLGAADRLTVPQERAGFHFSATQRNRLAVFLLQNGAKAERDAAGRLRMHDTLMLAGIRRYKEIVMDRMAPLMSERDAGFRVEALFAQGKLSMMLTTYYGLNALRQADIAYDIAPLPPARGSGHAGHRHRPRREQAFAPGGGGAAARGVLDGSGRPGDHRTRYAQFARFERGDRRTRRPRFRRRSASAFPIRHVPRDHSDVQVRRRPRPEGAGMEPLSARGHAVSFRLAVGGGVLRQDRGGRTLFMTGRLSLFNKREPRWLARPPRGGFFLAPNVSNHGASHASPCRTYNDVRREGRQGGADAKD
ncbi:GntR family transcriptional regulator [Cohnella ginsengisoli]|uniref:GntR family transcriptional regulator n=1 Tax=Cohnella ginsengisoli TaxID=425004 RepID=A0A9X4KDV1_9BACL|nr:GntR family transcriptional regulator [Cohnella ginsengisoli]MDG0790319.1 GntR family transcriptional regulator [Cohnella ginsengisoli]